MTEPSSSALTDQALARLRKFASGNGLAPEKIEMVEKTEQLYVLEGTLHLLPFCEPQVKRYIGSARGGKNRIVLADANSLHGEIQRRREAFLGTRDWLPAAIEELKTAPGQGWGLDGSKITLPQLSVVLLASTPCPTCRGQKMTPCEQCQSQGFTVCIQCHGRGLEQCWNCAGSGISPVQPGTPCMVCRGERYAPCRMCTHTGKITCPYCHGRRGIVCGACQGGGSIAEEVTLTCGATVNFKLNSEGLPSGLRRGLDRVGIANLGKGHADIKLLPSSAAGEEGAGASDPSVLHYQAALPYSDIKLRFGGGRIALVSAFGTRVMIIGAPPFLDESLRPYRERLQKAARGSGSFENVLEGRAMRDALMLELSNKGNDPNNLLKLYPIGLSSDVAMEIMRNMRRALSGFTRKMRLGVATGAGIVGSLLMAVFLLTPTHAQLIKDWPWYLGMLFDLGVLGAVLGLCWVALNKSIQFTLQRRFPDLVVPLSGNSGRLGTYMLGSIAFVWLFSLLTTPFKPQWIQIINFFLS